MEEKTIVITEKAENQILGQMAVFDWQMKEKKECGRFLFFKYCQYDLVRDRNNKEITQAHIDVENRWLNEFNVWNQFILKGLKKYIIAELLAWLMIIVGFVMMMIGYANMSPRATSLPGSYIAGLIIVLLSLVISIPCLIIYIKNANSRIKKMDEISRDMRQVNAIRNNK